MTTSYRINPANVSAENIDGEVIIVNLASGTYYSTLDLGVCLWSRITAGHSIGAILDELRAAYPGEYAAIESTVHDFIAHLERENLIERSDGMPAASDNAVEVVLPAQFTAPVLNCYSDMQDMLLLDPVHDVADVGWPVAKPE